MKRRIKSITQLIITLLITSLSIQIAQKGPISQTPKISFLAQTSSKSTSKWWNSSSSKNKSQKKPQGGWNNFKVANKKKPSGGFGSPKAGASGGGKVVGYRDEQPARTTRNLYDSKSGILKKKKKHYAASPSLTGGSPSRTHKWETINFNRSSKDKAKPTTKPEAGKAKGGWSASGSTGKGWNAFKKQTQSKDTEALKENLSPKKKKKFKVFKGQRTYRDGDQIVTEEIVMDAPDDGSFTQADFDAMVANMDKSNPNEQNQVETVQYVDKVDQKGEPYKQWNDYLPGNGKIKPEVKGNNRRGKVASDKKKKCLRKAGIILEAQKMNCLNSKASSKQINDCLEKGKGLAQVWSKKCGAKIKYNFDPTKRINFGQKIKGFAQKSPEEQKTLEQKLRCVRNARESLGMFLQHCWNENYMLGLTGERICKLAIKKRVGHWEQKCGKKFKFKTKFERTKVTKMGFASPDECTIKGDHEILKVIRACWRDNHGLPKLIRRCLMTKGKNKAEEWSKHCNKKIVYNPHMPEIGIVDDDGHKDCIARAKKSLQQYTANCYGRHRGRSWKIQECLKRGKSLANKWAKECKVLSIRYRPRTPKIPISNKKACKREAYHVLRLYIAGCWRKYQENNLTIDSCLRRGQPISEEWAILCKSTIKYEPTRPVLDSTISCKEQAGNELKIYMKDCYKEHIHNHHDFKACLLDGHTLAKLWGDRCNENIPYSPVIPEHMPHEEIGLNGENLCIENSMMWLHVYEKDCWFNHRGNYKDTISCLRKGLKYSSQFEKKCHHRIDYTPKLPIKKLFCVNTANHDIREFSSKCQIFNMNNPGRLRKCGQELMDVARKWEKECNGILVIRKSDNFPEIIPKNQNAIKMETSIENIHRIEDSRIEKIFEEEKISEEKKRQLKIFLMESIESELHVSIVKTEGDINKAINKALRKQEVLEEIRSCSVLQKNQEKTLTSKVDELINSNPEELLLPPPEKLQKINMKIDESTDPDYLNALSAFQKYEKKEFNHKVKKINEYNEQMVEYSNWNNESNNWITRLKAAKSKTQYDQILSGYSHLLKDFKKKFKNCLPPPPPAPQKKLKSPVENRCHVGYKKGFKHGKSWAKMVSNDNGTFMGGRRKLKCLIDWLKEKKNSLHHICAIRGAKAGYKRWWKLLHDKKKLQKYRLNQAKYKQSEQRGLDYYKSMALKLDKTFEGISKGIESTIEGSVDVGEDIGEGVVNVGEDIGKGVVNVGENIGKDIGKGVVNVGENIGHDVFNGVEGIFGIGEDGKKTM